MSTDVNPTDTETKRVKIVQIQLQFIADTDEQAIAVKQVVAASIEAYPDVQMTFGIQEHRGNIRMPMRR